MAFAKITTAINGEDRKRERLLGSGKSSFDNGLKPEAGTQVPGAKWVTCEDLVDKTSRLQKYHKTSRWNSR